jgi:hypothetical protein
VRFFDLDHGKNPDMGPEVIQFKCPGGTFTLYGNEQAGQPISNLAPTLTLTLTRTRTPTPPPTLTLTLSLTLTLTLTRTLTLPSRTTVTPSSSFCT